MDTQTPAPAVCLGCGSPDHECACPPYSTRDELDAAREVASTYDEATSGAGWRAPEPREA